MKTFGNKEMVNAKAILPLIGSINPLDLLKLCNYKLLVVRQLEVLVRDSLSDEQP